MAKLSVITSSISSTQMVVFSMKTEASLFWIDLNKLYKAEVICGTLAKNIMVPTQSERKLWIMQKYFIKRANCTYFNEKIGLWWLVKSLLSWGLLTYNQSIHNIKLALSASKSLQIARNIKWGYLQFIVFEDKSDTIYTFFFY